MNIINADLKTRKKKKIMFWINFVKKKEYYFLEVPKVMFCPGIVIVQPNLKQKR